MDFYPYDSPLCLVDLLQNVNHQQKNRENFTKQAQAIGFTTVLRWIVLSWTMNKRKGQNSQEEDIECCLNAKRNKMGEFVNAIQAWNTFQRLMQNRAILNLINSCLMCL